MKLLVVFKLTLLLLIYSGCQSNKAESKPSPTPKKKAEFKREIFDVEKSPGLTAVGKLEIEKSWCAITLVAENIAVTAGHCLIAEQVDLFKNEIFC